MSNSTTIKVTYSVPNSQVLLAGALRGSNEIQAAALDIQTLLQSIAAGMVAGSFEIAQSTSSPVRASGTLTLSSASGAVGGVINGVTITDTASGGDEASAGLIADAINASTDALIAGIVTASAAGAVVTVTAVDAGKTGNAITFAASGSGVTASGSGRLEDGAGCDTVGTSYTGHL